MSTTITPSRSTAVERKVAVVALTVMTVDQITKAVAFTFAEGNHAGFFVPADNPRLGLGVAGAPLPLVALLAAIGIVAFGAVGLRRARAGLLPAWVPGFLIGGATSNILDRLVGGAVHDFLATPWLIGNLADLVVIAGIVGWVVSDLRFRDGRPWRTSACER